MFLPLVPGSCSWLPLPSSYPDKSSRCITNQDLNSECAKLSDPPSSAHAGNHLHTYVLTYSSAKSETSPYFYPTLFRFPPPSPSDHQPRRSGQPELFRRGGDVESDRLAWCGVVHTYVGGVLWFRPLCQDWTSAWRTIPQQLPAFDGWDVIRTVL